MSSDTVGDTPSILDEIARRVIHDSDADIRAEVCAAAVAWVRPPLIVGRNDMFVVRVFTRMGDARWYAHLAKRLRPEFSFSVSADQGWLWSRFIVMGDFAVRQESTYVPPKETYVMSDDHRRLLEKIAKMSQSELVAAAKEKMHAAEWKEEWCVLFSGCTAGESRAIKSLLHESGELKGFSLYAKTHGCGSLWSDGKGNDVKAYL